jgi:hypothetical protein
MDRNRLLNIVMFLSICSDFLKFIDRNYRLDGVLARDYVETFFETRYDFKPKSGVPLPFVQAETRLAMLALTFCFACTISEKRWCDAGFAIDDRYRLSIPESELIVDRPCIKTVLRTIWSACQHSADYSDEPLFQTAIVFYEGTVTFNARAGQVHFATTGGFELFLDDYVRALQKIAIQELKESAC